MCISAPPAAGKGLSRVCTCSASVQAHRIDLAKDHIALMAIVLELDGNRTGLPLNLLGSHLWGCSWPGEVLTREPSLALQKWVTVVLWYLKELDTILNRRKEFVMLASLPCTGSSLSQPLMALKKGLNRSLAGLARLFLLAVVSDGPPS